MTLAIVYSRATFGISAPLVTVEAHISPGMAGFCIVGLPEVAVKESRDRIRSAFINSNIEFPARRITVNLAPADLPKEGGRFDLPIALGILAASGHLPLDIFQQYEFVGELALSGELRGIQGILPIVFATQQAQRSLIVPTENSLDAALYKSACVYGANHLLSVCEHLKGETMLERCNSDIPPPLSHYTIDLSEVRGQPQAKRALEIAAAGKHSLLMIGPPGTGKTMLAHRLPTLIPDLNEQQALEIAAITSMSRQGFDRCLWRKIPYRAPHHSSSAIALVGGGRPPRPGEISLAHHGILFLDELPEFNRQVLESLREPLESGEITISRSSYQVTFPASFQLIAAMNPCPCGFLGSQDKICQCSHEQVKRYLGKLSGPFLDRIDMQVIVNQLCLPTIDIAQKASGESSDSVKARITSSIHKQFTRQGKANAQLSTNELSEICVFSKDALQHLNQMMSKFQLSARLYHRIIKLALTIADLAEKDKIEFDHVSEAYQMRPSGLNSLSRLVG